MPIASREQQGVAGAGMARAGQWGLPPGDKVRHDGGRLKRASEAIIGVISSFSAWGGKLIGEFYVTDVM